MLRHYCVGKGSKTSSFLLELCILEQEYCSNTADKSTPPPPNNDDVYVFSLLFIYFSSSKPG